MTFNSHDQTYHSLLQDVLDNGELITSGRTKESYYSVFGRQARYDLRKGFPLITTKKVWFKGVAIELLWFLRGDTNVKYLQDNGVHIWDEWATKEQCAKFGRKEGDLGPIYGKQWRKWDNYVDVTTKDFESATYQAYDVGFDDFLHVREFENHSIDQIANAIKQIKINPNSRRHIISAWNPNDINKVELPACHSFMQFYVSHNKTRLNCQFYSRSCDAALGLPFNIASYALLTHMIAQVCEIEVGDLIHSIGDLHIYENHRKGLEEQLKREPMPTCKLWLNPEIKNIDDFKYEDIKIVNYVSHPKIDFEVAI